MRPLVLGVFLALTVLLSRGVTTAPSRAWADQAPAQVAGAPAAASPGASAKPWGDAEIKKSYRQAQPPAVGGAYRYKQIAFGLLICALMGGLTVWLIRRNTQPATER